MGHKEDEIRTPGEGKAEGTRLPQPNKAPTTGRFPKPISERLQRERGELNAALSASNGQSGAEKPESPEDLRREKILSILSPLQPWAVENKDLDTSLLSYPSPFGVLPNLMNTLSDLLTREGTTPETKPELFELTRLVIRSLNTSNDLAKVLGRLTASELEQALVAVARVLHMTKKASSNAAPAPTTRSTTRPTPSPRRQTESRTIDIEALKAQEERILDPGASGVRRLKSDTVRLTGASGKTSDEGKEIDEVPITIRLVLNEMISFQETLQQDEAIEESSRQTLTIAIKYCLDLMQRTIKRMLAAEPKEYERLKARANRALTPLKEIKNIIEILQDKAHQDPRFRIIVITDGIIAQMSALRAIAEGLRLGLKNGDDINEGMNNEQQINGISMAFGLNHASDKVIIQRLKQLFQSSKELFPHQTVNNLAAEELMGFMLETPLNKSGEAYQQWTTQTLVRSAGLLVPIDLGREPLAFFIQRALQIPEQKKPEYRNLSDDDVPRLESLRVALDTLEATSKRPENQDGSNRIDMRQAFNFAGSIIGYMVLVPTEERKTPPFQDSFEHLLGNLEAVARGTATVMDASVTTDYMRQLEASVKTGSDHLSEAERAAQEEEPPKELDDLLGDVFGEEKK